MVNQCSGSGKPMTHSIDDFKFSIGYVSSYVLTSIQWNQWIFATVYYNCGNLYCFQLLSPIFIKGCQGNCSLSVETIWIIRTLDVSFYTFKYFFVIEQISRPC